MILHLCLAASLRDQHCRALVEDYQTRLRRWGRLELHEGVPRAGQAIWPQAARYRILCDAGGQGYASEALATQVQRWAAAHGPLAFAIGGADGHDAATRAAAETVWSLGPGTLPHQLACVVVAEQLYRAVSILQGTGYHHG